MLFNEIVIGIGSTFSGPKERIVVGERGEKNTEEETYGTDDHEGRERTRAPLTSRLVVCLEY